MIVESKSFIGDHFKRPTPEIFVDETTSFCLVVTPWGDKLALKTFQQMIVDYYLSASKDTDLTSPYPLLPHLSKSANFLRIAVMLATDWLHSQFNKDEYQCCVELFVVTLVDNECLWIKHGNPNVIFGKAGQGLLPIESDLPLSLQMGLSQAPPLPINPLGLHAHPDIAVQGFKYQQGDKFILISKQIFEPQILKLSEKQWTLTDVSNILSQDSKEPFWTAVVTL